MFKFRNKTNQRYQLHRNAIEIVCQYLPTLEDLICVEFTNKKYKGIIENFSWNPIELKQSTKKYFPKVTELHLYQKYNDKFLQRLIG